MELKLAIEAKNLRVLNKAGAVAICTLWLPVDMVLKSLRDTSPDFLAPKSPLALIGGLYGGGLSIMLRNLHHNPQIDSLILMGKDFSGGAEHLKNFFAGKVKLTGRKQFFIFGDGRREELETIIIRGDGSDYIMDGLLKPNDFKAIPKIYDWSKVPLDKVKENVANFLSTYSPKVSIAERPLAIELPKPEINTYPSDIFGQTIIAKTIPEAWKELLSTIARFGKRVKFRNLKERLEILNLKVVIHEPSKLEPEEFKLLNLSESALEEYKNELINKEIYGGLPYTYGNRMRQYFNCDLLLEAIKDLSLANDSRHAYISLWDNLRDPHGSDTPCLVTVFFRKTEGKIHLSALF
ncbi:MAG: hypothetical protein LBE31_06095, partial [Deltaproteobacteria bacterium]|nr:hypothetical protein [Deltaproteobacteria bacterium]